MCRLSLMRILPLVILISISYFVSAITRDCLSDEFDCGNGRCVPKSWRCDFRDDCYDNTDEENCDMHECMFNNGGCSQKCVKDVEGFHCECHAGYQLLDDGSCEDVDECQTPSLCSQICNNTKGGFRCSCVDGYDIDQLNHRRCKAQMGPGAILLADRINIKMIDLETTERTVVASGFDGAWAVDYDFNRKLVLWSDTNTQSISSVNTENGESGKTIVRDVMTGADGLSVDWIYGNVYWTDKDKKTIGMASLDGKLIKVLFDTDISKPHTIVVNPLEGWMFWQDWGESAKIERAGMDGSHRSTIVSKYIRWPFGLAIDFVSRKLYWLDSKFSVLCSSEYDGSNIQVIVTSSWAIKIPFGLDVFEDWLYWSDSYSVYKANKFTGENLQRVDTNLYNPSGMRVYHPYKKPDGPNYCGEENGGCSHFCLPAPRVNSESSTYTCACPEGMVLTDNQRDCIVIAADECKFYNGGCPQKCVDEDIGFHCECDEGYYLNNNGSCEVDDGALLLADRRNLKKIDLKTSEYTLIVSDIHDAYAVDYNFDQKIVVWSSSYVDIIYSANVEDGESQKAIVSGVSGAADGLAVDWIYGNLYWTDRVIDAIGVASLDGRLVKSMLVTNLNRPGTIVVNPLKRWMFWADWGQPAKIERAGMDGSHRSTIVSKKIYYPFGLAIDFDSKRLYWADSEYHALSSSNYDGSNVKVILTSFTKVRLPFSLDVSRDWLYWSDLESQSIYKVDKVTGKNLQTVASDLISPAGMRVYNSRQQPTGRNFCDKKNGGCSHFCLPAPRITPESPKYTCACPDGMELAENRKNCILIVAAPMQVDETPGFRLQGADPFAD